MIIKLLNLLCVILMIAAIQFGAWYMRDKKSKMDTQAPEIVFAEDSIECSIHADNKELLEGVTAIDNVDGDISENVMISGIQITNDPETEENTKEFEITYVVFDSSNNMTTASRKLSYTDYYSPRFGLKSKLQFDSVAAVKLLNVIKAEDCIDGNISGQVSLQQDRECTGFGTYDCVATVTNSLGDSAQLLLTYRVVDSASDEEGLRPDITLTDYIIYLKKGAKFRPTDYLSELRIDHVNYKLLDSDKVKFTEDTKESGYGYNDSVKGIFMLKEAINITSDVDVNTPGVYNVRYLFRHPVEKLIGTADLMVIVE